MCWEIVSTMVYVYATASAHVTDSRTVSDLQEPVTANFVLADFSSNASMDTVAVESERLGHSAHPLLLAAAGMANRAIVCSLLRLELGKRTAHERPHCPGRRNTPQASRQEDLREGGAQWHRAAVFPKTCKDRKRVLPRRPAGSQTMSVQRV